MKTIRITTGIAILITLTVCANAQINSKQDLEQDFENYKKQEAQNFSDFKKKRAEELKRMEQEYQDYYNSMVGLKKYYIQKKDTVKANVVDEAIKFESKVSATLGKPLKVTENITITREEQPATVIQSPNSHKVDDRPAVVFQSPKQQPQDEQPEQSSTPPALKHEELTETTFVARPEDGDAVPVLTPLPKSKAKITSPFGIRVHPTLGRPIKHNGVDFGSGKNTEVYAAAGGKVVLAEYNKSYGNYIIIEHKDGTGSVYAHLEKMATSKGSKVRKGELIGYTGSTGRSSGAHLHYEVRVSGTPVDPAGYLKETK